MADNYADELAPDDLEGKRIGIIREPMNDETDTESDTYARVREVLNQAYADLEDLGAEVVDPIEIPDLSELIDASGGGGAETEAAIDAYLEQLDDPPVSSFEEIATPQLIVPTRRGGLLNALNETTSDPAYLEAQQSREELRQAVLSAMADHDLDAVAYATFDQEPYVIPDDVLTNPDALEGLADGSNRSLSPLTGFPASPRVSPTSSCRSASTCSAGRSMRSCCSRSATPTSRPPCIAPRRRNRPSRRPPAVVVPPGSVRGHDCDVVSRGA